MGHCKRNKEKFINDILLGELASVGRPARTIEKLKKTSQERWIMETDRQTDRQGNH